MQQVTGREGQASAGHGRGRRSCSVTGARRRRSCSGHGRGAGAPCSVTGHGSGGGVKGHTSAGFFRLK
ncbi:hypothetical protein V6N12_026795 [Hibiscus sabdariffa]|uniref:Uncharacterized protein n=1 Tax=Hibiscus sabdariffa TaxID=183260 RepID=A0ABR2DTC4_9ROSI